MKRKPPPTQPPNMTPQAIRSRAEAAGGPAYDAEIWSLLQYIEYLERTVTPLSEAGKKGGKRRAQTTTPERRSEISRRAANAKWEKWRDERNEPQYHPDWARG